MVRFMFPGSVDVMLILSARSSSFSSSGEPPHFPTDSKVLKRVILEGLDDSVMFMPWYSVSDASIVAGVVESIKE